MKSKSKNIEYILWKREKKNWINEIVKSRWNVRPREKTNNIFFRIFLRVLREQPLLENKMQFVSWLGQCNIHTKSGYWRWQGRSGRSLVNFKVLQVKKEMITIRKNNKNNRSVYICISIYNRKYISSRTSISFSVNFSFRRDFGTFSNSSSDCERAWWQRRGVFFLFQELSDRSLNMFSWDSMRMVKQFQTMICK